MMPHLTCIGPDQAYDFLMAMMARWEAVELAMPLIRGDGDAVLVERVERFRKRSGDAPDVVLRSMGAFELCDGKITHWRDYFDPREAAALAG
jgi:limonene-1,2-epoxide hydrolase